MNIKRPEDENKMSYIRFSDDSDVYVYVGDKGITCCSCRLNPIKDGFHLDICFDGKGMYTKMISHLEQHKRSGHKIPSIAIKRIREDYNTYEKCQKCGREDGNLKMVKKVTLCYNCRRLK